MIKCRMCEGLVITPRANYFPPVSPLAPRHDVAMFQQDYGNCWLLPTHHDA